MNLGTVVLPEEPGRYESLAICLQGVAESVRGQIDYDDLCSALGLSMTTVSAGSIDAPGWWMTCGRDLLVEPVAELFGIRLRNLHPPGMGVELYGADEFEQHFEASYEPLIARAIENGQPVLAWRGWPDLGAYHWGVITGVDDQGFTGRTIWRGGQIDRLVEPTYQCYVVEECEPVAPPLERLFKSTVRAANVYINQAPFAPLTGGGGPLRLVTGPAAYDAWELWIEHLADAEAATAWTEHRQHAEFITASRRSAIAFLKKYASVAGPDRRDVLAEMVAHCEAVVEQLAESVDEQRAASAFRTRGGRERLLAGVHAAEAAERRLAAIIESLA